MKNRNINRGNSMNRGLFRLAFLLVPLVLACFGLSPTARAVVPAPDGGYVHGNTAEGTNALFSLTTGGDNTAIGFEALFHNTTGDDNTANGFKALFSNTTGNDNTATGLETLYHNSTGVRNTANGFEALFYNSTGFQNTATGDSALFYNTTGNQNTANGADALYHNTGGTDNAANGAGALFRNTTGVNNTANGAFALYENTTGHDNTANGIEALYYNIRGDSNTALGSGALIANTGSNNIAIGSNAGSDLTNGSNNIDIGASGYAAETNTIRIGKGGVQTRAFIQGISGVSVNGSAVQVSSNGQLGVAASSARFKEAIKPMGSASDAILGLKPVTFRYKKEIDSGAIPQFGLVAEDVERVNPDLVARDEHGKPFTVRYEAVNAMLLNEFLKAHRKMEDQNHKIEEQEATIAQLKKEMVSVVARLKQHEAKIQKVNDQIEIDKFAVGQIRRG